MGSVGLVLLRSTTCCCGLDATAQHNCPPPSLPAVFDLWGAALGRGQACLTGRRPLPTLGKVTSAGANGHAANGHAANGGLPNGGFYRQPSAMHHEPPIIEASESFEGQAANGAAAGTRV